ncbi:MAG: diadenylate cyclase [Proteobacteria bacterium]|nr:diadenylate cyclase [Pseudomonadota bacterium]
MQGAESFIFGIRWQDIVDILFNSFILYRLYILFKGTSTFRALALIAFLWFFQRIATAMGLVITSWAIQGFTAAGAIIVIVVFRNEIRSVFQAVNLKTVFWGTPQSQTTIPINVISESVFELAEKRIGALLVIAGRESIEEIIQNGINWMGLLSKEMLLSIFWKENPVHDGAAIVEGDRVTRVGVILPLSRREDLPSYYGTRHRAAVGMAEESDSLVILVSEERGEVLAAKRHHLEIIRNPRILEKRLHDHLRTHANTKAEQKQERKSLFFAATICLLFVTAVWFGIARSSNTLVSYDIPIEFLNNDPQMEVIETSVSTVKVHLSGSSFLVQSLRPGQIRVRTSISGAKVGKNEIPITLQDVALPPGILLNKIDPPQVEVLIGKPTLNLVPVQVDWAGKLPEELVLSSVKISPDAVVVSGRSSEVKNIGTIYTEKVELNKMRWSGKRKVNLILDKASLKLSDESKTVTIEYQIKKKETVKTE